MSLSVIFPTEEAGVPESVCSNDNKSPDTTATVLAVLLPVVVAPLMVTASAVAAAFFRKVNVLELPTPGAADRLAYIFVMVPASEISIWELVSLVDSLSVLVYLLLFSAPPLL